MKNRTQPKIIYNMNRNINDVVTAALAICWFIYPWCGLSYFSLSFFLSQIKINYNKYEANENGKTKGSQFCCIAHLIWLALTDRLLHLHYHYSFQHVIVMDTRAVVVSIWSYINFPAVYPVVFVSIVVMQQLVVIVIIVRKAITETQPNRLIIAKYANVSKFHEKKVEIIHKRWNSFIYYLCHSHFLHLPFHSILSYLSFIFNLV